MIFEVGDKVELTSDSPIMSVVGTVGSMVTCAWFDADGKSLGRDAFPAECLKTAELEEN